MAQRQENIIELRFTSPCSDQRTDTVSLDHFVRVTSALKEFIWILEYAFREEKGDFDEESDDQYMSQCDIILRQLRKGSFVASVELVDDNDLAFDVKEKLFELLEAIVQEDKSALECCRLDSLLVSQFFEQVRRMFISSREAYELEVRAKDRNTTITSNAIKNSLAKKWHKKFSRKVIYPAMIGKVSAVDFERNEVSFSIPGADHVVTAELKNRFRETVIENRLKLVEVKGDVLMGSRNLPQRIKKIEHIVPLDLSDFKIEDVLPEHLRLKENVILEDIAVRLSEGQNKVYYADHEFLDLYEGAHTREALLEITRLDIEMVWKDCVKSEMGKLAPLAIPLRDNYLSVFEEVE